MRLVAAYCGRVNRAAGRMCSSVLRWLALAIVLVLAMPASRADNISYAYDEAGRLVQVTTPAGSAQYRYDTAGNLISVNRPAAGSVAIAEFSPNAGPDGTIVTIKGSGFSATPGSNAVKFNGTAALVFSASTGELKVAVPTGVTTGRITVTVGSSTGTSPQDFVVADVASDAVPMVASFSPQVADRGATVTITGDNFVGTPNDDLFVRVGGTPATIISATLTSIQFTVPNLVGSGHVTVGTRNGTAVSYGVLYVPPETGMSAANVSGIHTSINNSPTSLNTVAGKSLLVSFDGRAGQRLGLGISGLQTNGPGNTSTYVRIYGPGGIRLSSSTEGFYPPGDQSNLATLPVDGTYTMSVSVSGSYTASFTLTLSEDVAGVLTANGPAALVFQTNRVGQNASFSFAGEAGGSISILWTGATFSGVWSHITVYAPDGQAVGDWAGFSAGASYNPNGTMDRTLPAVSGTYRVFIDPYMTSTGQISVFLKKNDVQAAVVDGAPSTFMLAAGQNGDYVFDGVQDQYIGLGISGLNNNPSGAKADVTVTRLSDGAQLINCGTMYVSSGGGECDLPKLPATGKYSVRINPAGLDPFSGTLTLTQDDAATLTIGGATKTFDIATPTPPRVGQNARYAFNVASTGTPAKPQKLSVVYTGVTFPGASGTIGILQANGAELPGAKNSFGTGSYGTSGVLHLLSLPAAGSYAVYIDPALATLGKMTVGLVPVSSAQLDVGGAETQVNQVPGQVGDYTFPGVANERLGLGLKYRTTPWGNALTRKFYDPQDLELTVTCDGPAVSQNNDAYLECDFPRLTKTGTYTMRLLPGGAYGTTGSISLSRDLEISSDVTTTFQLVSIQRSGQNARFTFGADAGATVTIEWNGATLQGTGVFRLQTLAGAQIGTRTFSASSSGSHTFPILSSTGIYSLVVDPDGGALGQVNIKVTIEAPPAALSARVANDAKTDGVVPTVAKEPGDGDIPIPLWALLALGGAVFGLARRAQKSE